MIQTAPLSICILETDQLSVASSTRYARLGDVFDTLFSSVSHSVQCASYNVKDGQYPAPDVRFDAWLITGSAADAYGEEPWIHRLRDFICERYTCRDVLLGVCFGHQLLALALGGIAERATVGWGIGVQGFAVVQQPSWMSPVRSAISLIMSHRDQVSVLPPRAVRLATSDYCPNAAYFIDDQVLCFQGHPEVDANFMQPIFEARRAIWAPEQFRAAVASLALPHDGLTVASWMIRFTEAHKTASPLAILVAPSLHLGAQVRRGAFGTGDQHEGDDQ